MSMSWTPAEQQHMALLERWRAAMDLVGPGPLEPHFLDAARAVEGLQASGRWLDLGSGAGFPGLALAARWPQAEVVMVERRMKRARFLRELQRTTQLKNLSVQAVDSASLSRGVWDGVISRAYKPPEEVLRDAAALLRPGGRAVLLLSQAASPQRADMQRVLERSYPLEDRRRRIVVYERSE